MKVKGGKYISCKWEQTNQKSWGIFKWDEIDVKTNPITRNKEGPSNCNSACLFKETQNTNLKRHTHPYVHCSIFYNGKEIVKNVEETWVSIDVWMDEDEVTYKYNEMLISHIK